MAETIPTLPHTEALPGAVPATGRHADTPTPNYSAMADEIINQITGSMDVHDLVAAARQKLALAPINDGAGDRFEAPDAQLISELLANAADLERVAKTATAKREEIKTVLKEVFEKHQGKTELTVHGATVVTYKSPKVSRVLNQQYIKNMFPDVQGNEEFWMDQGGTPRMLLK